jgi:D-3-phosphoglycerate dehydrogenase
MVQECFIMARYKVVVTDNRHLGYEEEKKVLSEVDAELIIENCSTSEEIIQACKNADGILLNMATMNAEVIEKLQKCKVISRYGVGYDNLDVDACTRKGIWASNVPDYCTEEVSDHALALLMACVRKVVRRDKQVRAGYWNVGGQDPIYRIEGKTFAFLGFGKIARCLLRKIKGLNLSKILVYDPLVDNEIIEEMGCEKVELVTILKEADFISIHMPLNDCTRGLINKEAFELMKPSAILINTSRGAIVEEDALIEALSQRKINSAGLDVHTKEPMDIDSEFMTLENCVLTDHDGWYSEDSIRELKTKAAQNIKAVLAGGIPIYPINYIDGLRTGEGGNNDKK